MKSHINFDQVKKNRQIFIILLNPFPCILQIFGSMIISGTSSGTMYFWDMTTHELETAINAHYSPISALGVKNGRVYTASK